LFFFIYYVVLGVVCWWEERGGGAGGGGGGGVQDPVCQVIRQSFLLLTQSNCSAHRPCASHLMATVPTVSHVVNAGECLFRRAVRYHAALSPHSPAGKRTGCFRLHSITLYL